MRPGLKKSNSSKSLSSLSSGSARSLFGEKSSSFANFASLRKLNDKTAALDLTENSSGDGSNHGSYSEGLNPFESPKTIRRSIGQFLTRSPSKKKATIEGLKLEDSLPASPFPRNTREELRNFLEGKETTVASAPCTPFTTPIKSPKRSLRQKLGRAASASKILGDVELPCPDTPKKSKVATMTKKEMVTILKTYGWYNRLGQPPRNRFKRHLQAMNIDVTEEDIDALPWTMNGSLVNISKIEKILAAASKVLEAESQAQS